ncbi:MAG: TatD family hydrolase [Firmicutes bacterium]|nr:TatD family hydrolase [Bacillota bacterium]MCL5040604.1 TatD family hydrolase [Bacillota bacterium]
MHLIDTHAHTDLSQFAHDRREVYRRAEEAEVKTIINVGYDAATSQRSVQYAGRYPFVYAAVGFHPHDAKGFDERAEALVESLARQPRVVAIGEIGLDYYRDLSPRERQEEAFRRQIRLARRLQLPVIIHDRDAHADTIRILAEEGAREVGGVLHSFSGDMEMAREALDLGLYLGFSGPVTFSNGRRAQEIARFAPLDRVLLETDCPYLTPEPHRGRRNEPAYVRLIAEKIAGLRGLSLERLAEVTTENGRRLFGLDR